MIVNTEVKAKIEEGTDEQVGSSTRGKLVELGEVSTDTEGYLGNFYEGGFGQTWV